MKYSRPLINATIDLRILHLENQGTGALTPVCSGNCDFLEQGGPSSSALGVECRPANKFRPSIQTVTEYRNLNTYSRHRSPYNLAGLVERNQQQGKYYH